MPRTTAHPAVPPPASSAAAETLRGRVRILIDKYYEGSANKAAKGIPMEQTTLSRFLRGESEIRLGKLRAIAERTGEKLEWLVAGVGNGPEPARPPKTYADVQKRKSGETLRWLQTLRDLTPYGLSENAVGRLGAWPHHEPFSFAISVIDPTALEDSTRTAHLDRALGEWLDGHYALASAFVGQLVDAFRPAPVAARLERISTAAELGFDRARTEGLRLAPQGRLRSPLPGAPAPKRRPGRPPGQQGASTKAGKPRRRG
jgi:transcriptional regulator with XRE-family HTH domain